MNSYDFQDLNEFFIDKVWIPSSAMFYDGILLEDKIEGYQTLSVNGREMLSLDVQTDNVLNGVLINSQRLNSRTLTIKYKLECKTAEEVQEKYKLLMQLLYREKNVEIKFYDEAEWSYYGRYISSDEVDGSSNSIVSSFSILCESPFKYSDVYALKKGKLVIDSYHSFIVDSIQMFANTSTVTVSNSRQTIKVLETKSGDVVQIHLYSGEVYINGILSTDKLDLMSDFTNFTLKKNDEITSNASEFLVNYRAVSL